jgi:hypothetical protein
MLQLPKAQKIYLSFWVFSTEQCQYFGTNLNIGHDFQASTYAIISLGGGSSNRIEGFGSNTPASRPCIALLHTFLSNTNSLTHSYISKVNTRQLPKAEKIYLSFLFFLPRKANILEEI